MPEPRRQAKAEKPVRFISRNVREELRGFPRKVRTLIGQAIYEAQCGGLHEKAKSMKGPLRDVCEIVADDENCTFRVVYTVKTGDIVYVLHAFRKKSKSGVRTPQKELKLILKRYKLAMQYEERNEKA